MGARKLKPKDVRNFGRKLLFFARSRSHARVYGKTQYSAFVNIRKPVYFSNDFVFPFGVDFSKYAENDGFILIDTEYHEYLSSSGKKDLNDDLGSYEQYVITNSDQVMHLHSLLKHKPN